MMNLSFLKNMNKNNILVGVAIIAILVTGVLIFANNNKGFKLPSILGQSDTKIAQKAIDYINTNKLSSTTATMGAVSEESGLVKVKIKIGAQEFDSYITKDGKFLFPQVFDMSVKKDTPATADNTKTPAPTTVTKSDKPMLEAFVVARCPYGIQMQRAMAEAVKNMPTLAPYMKARYFGSVSGNTITSMHGDAEAQENLRQICIREEQSAKYWAYVGCQMKGSGQEVACEKSTGVDSAKLASCISTPSKGVAYAKVDFALADKYGVTGSPTLILNGATIDESSYGGRSADGVKSAVCAGFSKQASFCSTKLNTAAAAVSFSATYSTSSAPAASTGSAGGCQAAQ